MAAFLNKFKALILTALGVLIYWIGRKDEKIEQKDQKLKGQLNAIHQAKAARDTRFVPERIKRLHNKYRRL